MEKNLDNKSKVPEFKGIAAEYYEKYYSPILFVQPAKDLASRLPENPGAIVELACGTGQVTRVVREKYPGAKITATDLNPDMMEVGKKIMDGGTGVDWKVMDAQVIEFNDSSFDTVVCQFGIMFFPDKQKSVNEVHRILKPGGKYLFSTWDRIEKQRTAEITRNVVNTFFKDDPTTFFDVPFAMYEPEVMEGLMKNSGFTNITVKNVMLEGTSPYAEEAAKGFVMGNPIYFEICRRDATLLHEIMKAVEKEFAGEFGEKSLRIPLSLWVTEGTK